MFLIYNKIDKVLAASKKKSLDQIMGTFKNN
jgi:hypothetical protein